MDKIELLFCVREDDWIAEMAIIANNVSGSTSFFYGEMM